MQFHDRTDAGRQLATRLAGIGLNQPVVLALPRGGVPVAAEVARELGAPLDVIVARKVGAPGHPELGVGAVAEGGGSIANRPLLASLGLSDDDFDELAADEWIELDRRVEAYRGSPLVEPVDHDVVLVDDGLATGVTAEAAIESLRRSHIRRLVLAVPVCAPDTAQRLSLLVDEVVCLASPPDFAAVGQWYDDFSPTSDEQVLELLWAADQRASAAHVDAPVGDVSNEAAAIVDAVRNDRA